MKHISEDPSKGFAFLECEKSRRVFGRDVYCVREKVREHALEVGTEVVFTITIGPKGSPQGDIVCRTDDAAVRSPT